MRPPHSTTGQEQLHLPLPSCPGPPRLETPPELRPSGRSGMSPVDRGPHRRDRLTSHLPWLQGNSASACQPGCHQRRIVVHGNANDLQPAWTIPLLPCHKARHLNLAGSAPGGPKVEQHHLAAVGIQVEPLVVEVRANKLRGPLVNQRGCRAGGVCANCRKAVSHQQQRQREPAKCEQPCMPRLRSGSGLPGEVQTSDCVQQDSPWRPNRRPDCSQYRGPSRC